MNTTERKAGEVLAVKPAVLAWLRAMVDKSELYQRKNVMNHAISGIGLLFDERDAAVAELIEKADNAARILHNAIAAGQIGAGYQTNLDDLRAALARMHGGQ